MGQVATGGQSSAVRRRRRAEGVEIQKTSFSLHERVLAEVRAVVQGGLAASASAFVEQAIEEKLRRMRRTALYAAYEEAARDPLFMADMEAVTQAFDATAGDGLK